MTLFAMHMGNNLLSCPVTFATAAIAATAVVFAWRHMRQTPDKGRFSLMASLGAFVFALQMLNCTLPGMPGTSGHFGGGVLLAIVLGPAAGIVTMSLVLAVQCLVFHDGGLLALGCNVINMAVIPCLLGGWIYHAIAGMHKASILRQSAAALLASLVGMTAGAALVPAETFAAGVLQMPFLQFLGTMLGVHLIIAGLEGIITMSVVVCLQNTEQFSIRGKAVTLTVAALLLAGVASWFASASPDGLEWSCTHRQYGAVAENIRNNSAVAAAVEAWQSRWTPMPDYAQRTSSFGTLTAVESTASPAWPSVDPWHSLAGVSGAFFVLLALFAVKRTASLAANVNRKN